MVYVFTCRHFDEVAKFKELLEAENAYYESVQTIAFLNIWGQVVGGQYAILYQHDKQLDMEVKC